MNWKSLGGQWIKTVLIQKVGQYSICGSRVLSESELKTTKSFLAWDLFNILKKAKTMEACGSSLKLRCMSKYVCANWFICLFLFISVSLFGQTRIDQLRSNIIAASGQPEKLKALISFCDEWDSYSPDTLKKYATQVKVLSHEQNNQRSSILGDYYQAAWLFQKNRLDTALLLINETISKYRKQFSYDSTLRKMCALKSNVLLRTTKMDELLAHNLEWMKESEKNNDTLGIARAAVGIGNVNSRLKKYDETLKWYRSAFHLAMNPDNKRKLSFLYNNMSVIFYHLNNEDSAMYYVRQGIRYSKEDGNLTNLANALNLQGGLLAEFKHLTEAELSFKQAIDVRKRIGDVYYLVVDMAQTALFYSNSKTPEKGVVLCKEALDIIARNGKDFQSMSAIYSSLGKCYLALGDHKNYSNALSKQLALKDSIYQRSSTESLAEMQTKYDLQKKETTIAQQKLALVSKNYQLYGSVLLLLLGLAASYIIFKQYKKKQRLKLQMMQEEEKRKSEKAIAEAEENERKRIAADLHDSLGAYAASITSNIDHLRLISNDPSTLIALQELRSNSMEIVSQLSDTIWALKKDALSLTTISDRIKVFVQRIQPSYPDITFDVFENIQTDFLLAPSQAFHLFQIVKEAVNNALRHSHGNYLIIDIKGDKIWKITISDNGQGMIPKVTLREGGNGLINMQTRAEESGWKIKWQSNRPAGTKVIIEPTTN